MICFRITSLYEKDHSLIGHQKYGFLYTAYIIPIDMFRLKLISTSPNENLLELGWGFFHHVLARHKYSVLFMYMYYFSGIRKYFF